MAVYTKPCFDFADEAGSCCSKAGKVGHLKQLGGNIELAALAMPEKAQPESGKGLVLQHDHFPHNLENSTCVATQGDQAAIKDSREAKVNKVQPPVTPCPRNGPADSTMWFIAQAHVL